MSNRTYSLEFHEEAVRQVLNRGYAVNDVAKNLGEAPAQLRRPEE
jgi:transposase-like protein